MLPVALNCTDGLRFLGAAWAPRVEGSGVYISLSPIRWKPAQKY